jgi:hypothetical protein
LYVTTVEYAFVAPAVFVPQLALVEKSNRLESTVGVWAYVQRIERRGDLIGAKVMEQ